jgi:N-acetylmuramoyl-L-alanine amidase
VIDPGHGGDDAGVKGAKGTVEKDYVLQLARRLKGTIEGRLGLRVLLTRDADENVPVDRRIAFANNNKADLFISLHANGSVRAGLQGAQVISLRAQDYLKVPGAPTGPIELPVPVVGGGTRSIDVVPWDLAQMPFAAKSATLSAILVRTLTEKGVPMAPRASAAMPMRVLVGTNMPAVLLEVGFLTNASDEPALLAPDRSGAIVEALMAMIGQVRSGVPAKLP